MNEKIISTLATESLKPVSAIVDALLGPKILRSRKWAEKQDIKDKLESVIIYYLFEEYFKRLLRRVSGITTIVFPQQVLPLTKIYEPLKMKVNLKDRYVIEKTKEQ